MPLAISFPHASFDDLDNGRYFERQKNNPTHDKRPTKLKLLSTRPTFSCCSFYCFHPPTFYSQQIKISLKFQSFILICICSQVANIKSQKKIHFGRIEFKIRAFFKMSNKVFLCLLFGKIFLKSITYTQCDSFLKKYNEKYLSSFLLGQMWKGIEVRISI